MHTTVSQTHTTLLAAVNSTTVVRVKNLLGFTNMLTLKRSQQMAAVGGS